MTNTTFNSNINQSIDEQNPTFSFLFIQTLLFANFPSEISHQKNGSLKIQKIKTGSLPRFRDSSFGFDE
jgi:hypothetical protein